MAEKYNQADAVFFLINLCPLSESGLAFFKKHRMCPANMQLAKVETVDVKEIVI